MRNDMLMIDGLQYVNWNRELFEEAQQSGVHTIHVTIAYWENIRETLENIGTWNRHFINHADLIMPVRQAADILEAKRVGKVGIIFGFQNCSPIEDDVKMVEILYQLGVRIMQLTYNNQSCSGDWLLRGARWRHYSIWSAGDKRDEPSGYGH